MKKPVLHPVPGRHARGLGRAALAAILFLARAAAPARAADPATDASAPADMSQDDAIVHYLREKVAPKYGGEWEHCVPLVWTVGLEMDFPDVLAWGEFRVFNYRLEGDTFHFVSGGNHPGLMRLRCTDGGFSVVSFDPVLDGSDHMPSAKSIFGGHFDAWTNCLHDEENLEFHRLQALADYAAQKKLPARFVQDPGRKRVRLPPAYGGIDPEFRALLVEPVVPASALEWREAAITDVARFLEVASPCP